VGETLVVMAKAPRVGTVKTRLHAALGAERATALYRCFIRDTFALADRVRTGRPDLTTIVCFAPEGDEVALRGLVPERIRQLVQRGADLGERLANCFCDVLSSAADRVVVVGADSPTLPHAYVAQAFEALAAGADVVVGPTLDGGYYLVGARALHEALFRDVPWSTAGVLAATLANAAEAGLSVAVLPTWYDVDEPSDLDRLRADLASCPSTRAFFGDG
jgi:rSAM/selenodomain-associated transferase 1